MQASPHILVVDDDREIRDLLSRFLAKHGFRVTTAANGQEMRRGLEDWQIDLVVLDLMLPGDDGLKLCRETRDRSRVPIIMLTAMGEETDRIIGLEMGADDYLAKPFNPRELLARIKAVLRRAPRAEHLGSTSNGETVHFAGWEINLAQRQLKAPGDVIVELTTGEYDLLLAFVEHPQRVLSRDQLLDLTRGRSAIPFDRSMDIQVSRLRRKIEKNPDDPTLIKTVRGVGYVFTPSVERA